MDIADFESIANIIQAIVSSLAIIIVGVWAYIQFVYRRERESRAEWNIELDFVGVQGGYWLAEFNRRTNCWDDLMGQTARDYGRY